MDMKNLIKKDFTQMFSNLCCSQCKNDFTLEGLNIIENNNDILICNLCCNICGKDFGKIVLNYSGKTKKHLPLEVIDGPPPINTDDVIDAHKFIKNHLK